MSGDPAGGSERSNPMAAIVEELVGWKHTRFCPVNTWQPDVNLYEARDAFLVCVDVSGMHATSFDVTVNSSTLLIRGRRQRPLPPGSAGDLRVHLMEINNGDFCREVEIPASVRQADIAAEYRDGLLWITLPKAQ